MRKRTLLVAAVLSPLLLAGCAASVRPVQTGGRYDLIVRHGMVYDGSGDAPRRADIGVRNDRIAARSRRVSSTCCRGRPIR